MEENEERVDLKQCNACKFYSTEDYEIEGVTYERTFGVCRRFPPRRIDGTHSGFPIVEDDWWCGEYVPE
jgi:hypothetical protein